MAVAQKEIEQAKAFARQDNSQAAIALLGKLIQRDAGNVEAWLALADVVEEPDRVEFCLQKVLNLDPGNATALEKLSNREGASLSVGSLAGPGAVGQASARPAQLEDTGEALEGAAPSPRTIQEDVADKQSAADRAAAPGGSAASTKTAEKPKIPKVASQTALPSADSASEQTAQNEIIAQVVAASGFLSSLGRTDLILIGLTVLAGLVFCGLVSTALLR
ncbi:MAG: tetratricopeptide repeat protein [Anaerolineales bacterium]